MNKHILSSNAIFSMIVARINFNTENKIGVFAETKAVYNAMWQHEVDLDRIFRSLREKMFEYCQCVGLDFLQRWEIEIEKLAINFGKRNVIFNSDEYYEMLICLICGFFQCQTVMEAQYCGFLDSEGVEIEKHVFVHDWSEISYLEPIGYPPYDNLLKIFKFDVKNGYK